MNSRNIFPILSLILLITTLVFAFLDFSGQPDRLQTRTGAPAPATSNGEAPSPPASTTSSNADAARVQELENEQKELKLLLERLSAELKVAQDSKGILDQLLLGRQVLRDFEKRFLSHPFFQKQGGFLGYFRKQTQTYLSQQEISIRAPGVSDEELATFRKNLTTWTIGRSDAEIQGVARYTAFFFAESLYAIPMNLLASRLVPELEAIDFNTQVLVQNVKTVAIRDANGELGEKGQVELERYNLAQQFFFRRGPKITGRVVLFLKSYLSYSDL